MLPQQVLEKRQDIVPGYRENMPQITIPLAIKADFLANMANLGNSWGTTPDNLQTQTLAFLSKDIDAVEEALENYPQAFLAHFKNQKLEDLADIRRVEELKGPNGLVLDDKTVLRMLAAVRYLEKHPEKLYYNWELTRGTFVQLPRELMLGLEDLSTEMVIACFDNVKVLTEQIMAVQLSENSIPALLSAMDEINAIDLTQGWPA